MNIILIIGGGISAILLVIGLVVTVREEQSVLDDRFSHYVEEEFEDAVALAEEQKTSAFSVWLDNQLEGSKFGDRIATNLAQADLKLRPAEYVAAMIIAAFLLGFFAWAIGGQNIISALMA
jgi:tight adherence protein B